MRHGGDEELREDLDHGKRRRHDRELHEEAPRRIDELWQKRREEQDGFRIRQRRQRTLPEQRPAGPLVDFFANIDPDWRRAPDLYAEPHEICSAHPLHYREPGERRLEQGADAEHRKGDDGDESQRAAEDGVERLATAVQRAVRQREQPVRPRRQRKPRRRQQVDEEGVEVHCACYRRGAPTPRSREARSHLARFAAAS